MGNTRDKDASDIEEQMFTSEKEKGNQIERIWADEGIGGGSESRCRTLGHGVTFRWTPAVSQKQALSNLDAFSETSLWRKKQRGGGGEEQ